MHLLISTLAMYQTRFWCAVARELVSHGHRVTFISFDERSHELLGAAGLPSVNAHASAPTGESLAAACARLNIDHPSLALSHERAAFGIRDRRELEAKFLKYLAAVEKTLDSDPPEQERPVLVQELGGFLSVMACFYAARLRGIDNWFIEPSFFKGRLFITANSLSAPKVRGRAEPSQEVLDYLTTTVQKQAIVIPRKDRLHYRRPIRKLANYANAKRLVQKLVDIYLLGKRYEFGYVGHHVRNHVRQVLNSVRLKRLYTPLEHIHRFVYYPLHVPGDVALTLRAPEFLDQIALVDFLARAVPWTHRVVVKEHPAMVGSSNVSRLRALLNVNDNVHLISPTVNNFEVIGRADAVVSINSKSGAEALLLGKPVVVLGDAFYRDSGLVHLLNQPRELPSSLRDVLADGFCYGIEDVRAFFQAVWDQTFPGELYDETPHNITTFSRSLLLAIGGHL